MKALTMRRMAAARLRANKRGYRSLVLGIFLSVFLVSTLCLCIQGIYLAQLEQKYRQAGYLDMFDLDDPDVTDGQIASVDVFDRVGRVSVAGEINGTKLCIGSADETGYALINYQILEGRMPENPGEIAIEQGALTSLNVEAQLGQSIALDIIPLDGLPEQRSYTLVGILSPKAEYLEETTGNVHYSDAVVRQFPSILQSAQEPAFATGRLAVHRVMTLKKGVSPVQAAEAYEAVYDSSHLYHVGVTGAVSPCSFLTDTWLLASQNSDLLVLFVTVTVLVAALLTGCCVGIAGSMDGILSKHTQEIGMLRAVGATRRQIRRIFGQESLLLALSVSPLAILSGCLFTMALAWRMPEQIIFRATPWLLLPIALLSAAVILLAGWFPLRRAANKMPMSVLRDTALLRKAKHIRSRKAFQVPRLLAFRQLRLYPARQMGAILLVALMLFSSCVLFAVVGIEFQQFKAESPAFNVSLPWSGLMSNFVSVLPRHTMTWQDVERLSRLPNVARAEVMCRQQLILLSEGTSSYFSSSFMYAPLEWQDAAKVYLQTDLDLVPEVSLVACDLSAAFPDSLPDGINLDAINAGKEVIVVAPTWWSRKEASGGTLLYRGVKRDETDTFLASNDYFYPGQVLQLAQLAAVDGEITPFSEQADWSKVEHRRISVSVGAIAEESAVADYYNASGFLLMTTLQGLRNMDLVSDGIRDVGIYLDGAIDQEAEEKLERSITAIANRSDDVLVTNFVELARENLEVRNQMSLLLGSVTLVFLITAVGLIVSGVTRQIRADARTIGMLRAVGADEKAVIRCYEIPIWWNVALGLALALPFYAWLVREYSKSLPPKPFFTALAGMLLFAAICAAMCQGMLRLRVREITRQSIIDNIREL